MSVEIKICGITTRDALLAAADAGATAIGFVFTESVRRVDIPRAATLARLAPPGLQRVAVFRHPPEGLVARVLADVPVNRVQCDAADFEAIAPALGGVPFVPVYRDSPALAVEIAAHGGRSGDLILVEGPTSGAGRTPDWARIAGAVAATRARVVLAGGLNPANVADAVRTVHPHGVDVSSGVESARGVKDPALIRDFVRAARAAFHLH